MEPQGHRNHPFGSVSSELLQPWNPRTWTNKWCRNCGVYNKWCRHELHRLYIKYDCYMNILYIHKIFHYAIHASLWVTVCDAMINCLDNEHEWTYMKQPLPTFSSKVSFFHVRSPDEVSFGACINAYSKGSRWRDALGLLDRMPELSIVPNTVNLGRYGEPPMVLLRSKHCFKTSMVLDFEHILQVV